MQKTWPALTLLAAALLAQGCTTSTAGTASAQGTAASATTTTTTPVTTTSTSPPPAPADADPAACVNADCRLQVSGTVLVPLDDRFGCAQFTVTHSAPNKVDFTVIRTRMNAVRATLMGTGHLALANGITVTIEQVDPSGAVLRFEPRTDDPTRDTARASEGLRLY